MRRLTPRGLCGIVLALAIGVAPSCKRRHHEDAVIPEQAAPLASVVNVADPDASAQLTQGFYQLENNAWRWTARKFTVTLKTPAGAAQNGAALTLKFNFPEAVFRKLGAMTISAAVNGRMAGMKLFSMPGDNVFSVQLPPATLAADAVSVDFECDKALPPTGQDARELALVVTSIGLEAK